MGSPGAVVRLGDPLMARPPGHYIPAADRRRRRAAEVRALLEERLPCTGCRHTTSCAVEYLACTTFRNWTATGSWHRGAPRVPSAEVYARLFTETDEE